MLITLKTIDSIQDKIPSKETTEFNWFLQLMQNRRLVGGLRYGPANRKKKYMTRLGKELTAYTKSGNAEQLINIAVYAFLEFYAPENNKYHFDNNAKSVTRRKMK